MKRLFAKKATAAEASGKTPGEEAREEVGEALVSLRLREAAEVKRRELTTDSEFWFCVCFQSRDDKEAFLRAIKFTKADKYISGYDLAKSVGVDMPEPPRVAKAHGNRFAKRWAALT